MGVGGPTDIKGHIGETVFAAEMAKQGYITHKPSVNSMRYDFLITNDSINFYRVQVKSRDVGSDGAIRLKLCTTGAGYAEDLYYTPDEIDYVAIYIPTYDICCYVPMLEGMRSIILRKEPASGRDYIKPEQDINNYLLLKTDNRNKHYLKNPILGTTKIILNTSKIIT